MKGERLFYVPEVHLYGIGKSLVDKDGREVKVHKSGRLFDQFEEIPAKDIDLDSSEYMAIDSVTKILGAVEEDGAKLVDFSAVPADLLDAARIRGTFVHDMIDADAAGELDEERLDPKFKGFLKSYRAWMTATGADKVKAIASEVAGVALFGTEISRNFLVAGRIDRIAEIAGEEEVVDFKSGVSDSVSSKIQAAAYTRIASKILGREIKKARVVGVRADGSFVETVVDVPKYLLFMDKIADKIADPSISIDVAAMAKDAARIPAELEDELAAADEELAAAKAKVEAAKAAIILATGGGSGIGSRWTLSATKATLGVDAERLRKIRPDLAMKFERAIVDLPASAWAIIEETVGELLDDTVSVSKKVDPKVLSMVAADERASVTVTERKGGFSFRPKKAK